MKIGCYAINLDEALERWASIRSKCLDYGIDIIRVAGVDGRRLSNDEYLNVDWKGFIRHGGRTILPGEYGCYLSHMSCLAAFHESDFDAALVMEDDIDVPFDLIERARAILDVVPNADIVKLFNHRSHAFLAVAKSTYGDEVGRCLHGPQGSAACYAITRQGAGKILPGLQMMSFPFDVALERGWHHGTNVLCVRRNIVNLTKLSGSSQIGKRIDYRKVKLAGRARLSTHFFRAAEYCRRVRYALQI